MLLRDVPAFVDQAHTPAAFAFRAIDDRLDGRGGTTNVPTHSV